MDHDAPGGRQGMVAALCMAAMWVMAMVAIGWELLVYIPAGIAEFRSYGVALPHITVFAWDAARMAASPLGVAMGMALLAAPLALFLPRSSGAGWSIGVLALFAAALLAALLIAALLFISIYLPRVKITTLGAAPPASAPSPAAGAPP